MSGLRFQPSPSCHLSPQMISGQWKLLFVLFEFNFAPLTIPLFQAIALLLLSHLGLSFLDWNLILVENLHVSCFFSDYTHAAVSPHKLGTRTRQVSAQIWAKVSKTCFLFPSHILLLTHRMECNRGLCRWSGCWFSAAEARMWCWVGCGSRKPGWEDDRLIDVFCWPMFYASDKISQTKGICRLLVKSAPWAQQQRKPEAP